MCCAAAVRVLDKEEAAREPWCGFSGPRTAPLAADAGLHVAAPESGDFAQLSGDLDGFVEQQAEVTLSCQAVDHLHHVHHMLPLLQLLLPEHLHQAAQGHQIH
ncbi:hypothetical protein EYF80_017018 [Liparis tanakae]|uniref:Uncharacterized protein n=1 Tax=Liparis tanakae TaxID=230148 RepID=A0A4Z2I5Y5_9TELE|nr:hypothetical protein EYF80_017018 [Liparis tanakae]